MLAYFCVLHSKENNKKAQENTSIHCLTAKLMTIVQFTPFPNIYVVFSETKKIMKKYT